VLGKHRHVVYVRTRDGRELRMGTEVQPFEQDNRPGRDELRVDQVSERPHPTAPRQRPPIRELHTIRAYVVAPGTYTRLVADDKATAERRAAAAARAASAHRVDVAVLLPQLDRLPERAIAMGALAHDMVAPASKFARMVVIEGRGPVRGIPAIIDWLSAQGVKLDVTAGGHLDVRARAISPPIREVRDAFGALIARRLAGNPAPCALSHRGTPPEAFTVAVGGCPVYVDCLEELA
jgi:hypothetical protein